MSRGAQVVKVLVPSSMYMVQGGSGLPHSHSQGSQGLWVHLKVNMAKSADKVSRRDQQALEAHDSKR